MTCARGSSRAAPPRASRRASGGFTLTELLTVIGIISVLAALSIGVVASLPGRLAHETAASSIRALLRRARAAALESRSEALVRFERGRVEARAWATLALFRFEDVPLDAGGPPPLRTMGARGMEGRLSGAVGVPGRIGTGLELARPGAHVDLGDPPVLSPRDGVRIEAWVAPGDLAAIRAAGGPGRPPAPGTRAGSPHLFQVAGKGDAFFLRVREDYAVVGGVRGEGRNVPILRETAPGALVPGRFAEVALAFDGEDLRILVNGLRADLPVSEEEARRSPVPQALADVPFPLTISSPEPGLSFHGAIDEVRVLGIVAEEAIDLPAEIAVDAPPAVRFDGAGELDPLFHDEPVRIFVRRLPPQGQGPRAPTATAQAAISVERHGGIR